MLSSIKTIKILDSFYITQIKGYAICKLAK